MEKQQVNIIQEMLLDCVHDVLREHPDDTDEQIKERVLTLIPAFGTMPLYDLMMMPICGIARCHIGKAKQEGVDVDTIRSDYKRKNKTESKKQMTPNEGLMVLIKKLLDETPNASAEEIKNRCYVLSHGLRVDPLFQKFFDDVYRTVLLERGNNVQ